MKIWGNSIFIKKNVFYEVFYIEDKLYTDYEREIYNNL